MSTIAQITANQLNAKSSTGPSTPEGKAASSRNATTHGISGSFCLLPHEDRTEFQRLLDSYAKTFKPADDHESYLVEIMLQSRWKTARLHRLEAAILTQMSAQNASVTDPDAMLAAAMLKGSANAYAQVQRYLAASERSYYKALHQLQNDQVQRRWSAQQEEMLAWKQKQAALLEKRAQETAGAPKSGSFWINPDFVPASATPVAPVAAVRADLNPRR